MKRSSGTQQARGKRRTHIAKPDESNLLGHLKHSIEPSGSHGYATLRGELVRISQ
jgi:hypothetical protein